MESQGPRLEASRSSRATRPAAFFRLEGVIHPAAAWEGAAYLASNARSIRQRLLGLGGAALSGLARRASLRGVGVASLETTRLAYAALEGFSRDRLEILGEDYARDVLLEGARPSALRLVEGAARDGFQTVLVSEAPSEIADAFARLLAKDGPAFDVVLANRLERDEREQATGALLEPLIGPEIDPQRIRKLAREHALELEASRAYGHAHADLVLLGLVGRPCAVVPDRELARVARDLDWPIVFEEAPFEPPTPETTAPETTSPTRDEGASL